MHPLVPKLRLGNAHSVSSAYRPLKLERIVDLISRTALAAVVCPKTGANAHRLILLAENALLQQSPGERAGVTWPPFSATQSLTHSLSVRGEGSQNSFGVESRPGFRHELASVLAIFAVFEKYQPKHPALLGNWAEAFEKMGVAIQSDESREPIHAAVQSLLDCTPEQFDLLVYLIASHHGKVRGALHASPEDQDYRDRDERGLPIRGVREGDRLPSIEVTTLGELTPELTLTLEPARLGLSSRTGASWRERCLGLVEQHGPMTLAYLESIFRAADVRASKLDTSDPALQLESAR